METTAVTGFVDVHDNIFYYAIIAWADDFTGYIIDYDTYPKQRRRVFNKSDKDLITLKKGSEDVQTKAIIQSGLVTLLKDLLSIHFQMENDENEVEVVRFSKILVDCGYVPEIVDGAMRLVNSPIIVPSKGSSVRATTKPMRQWNRSPGRVFGTYWIMDRPQGRVFRTVTVDVNYWKCRLHEAFSVGAGSRSGLTFWGLDSETHRMIADHCNSEIAQFVEAGESKRYEWQLIPGHDNHYFDCLVGNMVAASTCGIKLASEQTTSKRRIFRQ
jgi:hypothetical protein